MAWVDRQGRIEVIDAPRRTYVSPRLSPDGTRVAVHSVDKDRDILVWHFGRQTLTQLTFTPEPETSPVWTPDGRHIVFARNDGIFRKPADGAGTEERLATDAERSNAPGGFVPDGSRLLLRFFTRDGANGFSALNLTGDHHIEPLVSSKFIFANPSLSPNGRWIAARRARRPP